MLTVWLLQNSVCAPRAPLFPECERFDLVRWLYHPSSPLGRRPREGVNRSAALPPPSPFPPGPYCDLAFQGTVLGCSWRPPVPVPPIELGCAWLGLGLGLGLGLESMSRRFRVRLRLRPNANPYPSPKHPAPPGPHPPTTPPPHAGQPRRRRRARRRRARRRRPGQG